MKYTPLFSLLIFLSCRTVPQLNVPINQTISGSQFYKTVANKTRAEREQLAIDQILRGGIPKFLKQLQPIRTQIVDSTTGKTIHAIYFITPDYLSIGSDKDFARLPLTPMAAQQIADSLHCFLPTRKMVNDIYAQATIKLEPQPLFAFRDSAPTFYHHHLIIEGQRQLKKGLIAGIKKDVVLSGKTARDPKPNRVAIYGWHRLDGKPIQPLYTGHVDWYVDYSHGIRLVHQKILVDGQFMDYQTVLKHPILQKLLCDEVWCDCFRY
jgi:hypothetical protein